MTIELIQQTIAAKYGVSVRAILSPTRTERVTWARHVAMFLAQDIPFLSKRDIGRAFNRPASGSTIHALRKVEDRISAYPAVAAEIQSVKQLLMNA